MNKKESEEESIQRAKESIKEIKERIKEEERIKKLEEEGDKAMSDLLSIMDKMDEVDEDGMKNEK